MAVYLGNNKIKIIDTNGKLCNLYIPSKHIITNGIKLLSSEGYVLKDLNGLYLTTKEDK